MNRSAYAKLMILSLALPTVSRAQTCFEQARPMPAKTRIGTTLDLGDSYQSARSTLSLSGPRRLFGVLTAGLTRVRAGMGIAGGGGIGYAGIGTDRGIRICPSLSVDHDRAFGPATDFRVGFDGFLPMGTRRSRWSVSLITGAAFTYQIWSIGGGFVHQEGFGSIDGGLGLRLGKTFALTTGGRLYLSFRGGRSPSLIFRASTGI